MIFFGTALAVQHAVDDPRRAFRLAVRLALKVAPGRLRARFRALTAPSPRRADQDVAGLRALLADAASGRAVDRRTDRRGEGAGRASRSGEHAAGGVRTGAGVVAGGGVVAGARGEWTDGAGAAAGALGDSASGDGGPMTVLHLVTNALPRTQAGYTVRTHRIVTAQRALGLDPHVVTRLGYPLAQGIADARPRLEVDGVPYHRLLPWVPPRDPVAGVRKAARLAGRLVEELRPAVLHATSDHLNAAVALELRRRYGLPVVYEVRGFLEDSWLSRDPARSQRDDFYRLTRELETERMRAADLVVTLGEAMRAEIAGRGGMGDVLVVPNAVDEAFLAPLPDGAKLRADLGIAEGEVVVGTTSTFYGFEGIDTLIEAAALRRDVTLLLVGDGPERPALERQAAELGVRAIFTGRVPVDQVRRYHAVLDVFAVPRRADRVCQFVTPLKPLEAMAGGIPVIASDVKALREIIEPGVSGTLTLPEDAEAWANCLEQLIYSPKLRGEFGQAAREWVAEHRTWRAVAARYLGPYRHLASAAS